MQHAPRSKRNEEEKIEKITRAHFSHCPFCGTDYPMSREESAGESRLLCNNCRRKWSVSQSLGAVWFLRTNEPQQEKKYPNPWMTNHVGRSLEGIRPYLLFETDSKIGKQRVVEQGLDRFVWQVQPLIEYFDEYDKLVKGHSCERVKIAFACARMKTKEEREAPTPGLSIKQVSAVTNLSEEEASTCTQRLLDEGLISYEVRAEKGLTGVEAVIVGFLGEPIYQMNEHIAEKTINELNRMIH